MASTYDQHQGQGQEPPPNSSSFLPPVSSYNYAQRQRNTFAYEDTVAGENDAENPADVPFSPHVSSALSAPALAARLSSQSSKALPSASELLLSSASRNINTSNSISTNSRNTFDSQSSKNYFTNALSSITSLTNTSIPSQQQSQASPSIPPSPYLNTPSTYCSLTEPGTPVSQLYNEYGSQARSPSLPASMHSSNPASIVSSVPPSPASSLQRSPSAKSGISNRMGPTPTPDNQPADYHVYSNQAGTSISGADFGSTSRSFSQQYTIQQGGNSKAISFSPSPVPVNGSAVTKPSGIYKSPGYSSRSANRGKNSSNFSSVLQYKMSVDDGPTVKEHLQQQARHRMRQDILSKRTMDDEHVRSGLSVKRSNLRSSMSPQKVYLQPPQQIQSAQLPQVLYSSDGMVISSHQFDSANIRYSSSQPAKEASISQSGLSNNPPSAASTWSSSTSNNSQNACGLDSTDHHQSATFVDASSSANEHSNSTTANSDDSAPAQLANANLNDALASTIASVASGASGSLVDPGELLLESSFGGGNPSDIDDEEDTDVDDLDDDGHVEYYSGNCSTKSGEALPLPSSSVFVGRGIQLDGDSNVSGMKVAGRGAGSNPSERLPYHHQQPTYYIHQTATSSHPQQSVDSSTGSSLASSSPVSHQTAAVIPVSSKPRRSRGGSSGGVVSNARKRNGQPGATRGRGASKGTTRRQTTNKATNSIVVDQPVGAAPAPVTVILDRQRGRIADDSLRRVEDDSRQQCRIHVQNPPSNAACSFPPTETTIHVVQHSRFNSSHNNFHRNQQSSSSHPPNSVVSVQQHPSVAHIQQRQHHNPYQDTIDAERIRHIVVQQENNGVVVGSDDITAIEALPPPHTRRQQQQHDSGSSTASSSTAELQQLLQSKRQARISPSRNMSSGPPPSNPPIVLNHTQHYQQATAAAKLTSIKSPPPYHMVASSAPMMSSVSPPHAYHSATAATQSPAILTDAVQHQHPAGYVALPLPSSVDQQMDAEFRNYSLKLHHLRRTVKALVYKNGALSDELARLCQRISTVTEERRMLSKRLQHHERNKIRRIQTKHRKAAAAAAAASVVKAPPASAGPTAANSMTHSPASTNESFATLDDTKEFVSMRSGGGRNSLDALEHRITCADMKPLCVNTSTSDVEMKSPFTSHTTSRNCTPKISPSRPHSSASQHHQQHTGGNFGKMYITSGSKFQGGGGEEQEDGNPPDADYDGTSGANTSGGSLMMTLRSRSSSSTDHQHHQQKMNHQQQLDTDKEGGGGSAGGANELVSPRPGTRSSTRLSAERALTVGSDQQQQQTPTQGRATRYSARQQQQKMLEKQQNGVQSAQELLNTSGGIVGGGSDGSSIKDNVRASSRRRSRSATKKGDSISPRAPLLAVDTSTSSAEHNLSPRTRFSSRLNPTVVAGAPARSEEPSVPLKRRLVRSAALLINGAGRCSLVDEETCNDTRVLTDVDDVNDEQHTVRIRSINHHHHHSLEASDNEDYDNDIYDDETTPPRGAQESGDAKTIVPFICENNANKTNTATRQRQQSGTKKAK